MKSRSLKIASALLVLCLMSTCAIGATFAKYTTGDNASDTARVAKWGVEVAASGTLFGKAYGANDAIVAEDNNIATVLSSGVGNIGNVVAPGTKNETGFQVKLAGQPEVDFEVVVNNTIAGVDVAAEEVVLKKNTYGVMVVVHGVTATNFVADKYYTTADNGTFALAGTYAADVTYYKLMDKVELTEDYYPIAWTVANAGTTSSAINDKRLANIYIAIRDKLTGTYQANAPVDEAYTITWAWAFGTNDGADTILGNIAAGAKVVKLSGSNYVTVTTDDYNLKVAFGINVTATQLN